MTWTPKLVALDVDGCVLEWERGTDKSSETVTPAVRDAVARVVRAGVPVVLASGRAVEDPGNGYQVNRPFPRGELSAASTVLEPENIGRRRATRVMIRHPEGSTEDLASLATELGLAGTDYVANLTSWLDISPAGVSKASGLTHVAAQLGVAAVDVLAIGDGRNDLEMLQWAGRGVAMGQAVQDVHDAADASTASVGEDGVAVELDRWF